MTESSPLKPRDLDEALNVIAILHEQLQKSKREVELLRYRLDVLCRRLFGKKSEKVDPNQLQLAFEVLQEMGSTTEPLELDSSESFPRVTVRSHQRGKGRRPLPKELPRERLVLDVEEAEKTCGCSKERRRDRSRPICCGTGRSSRAVATALCIRACGSTLGPRNRSRRRS